MRKHSIVGLGLSAVTAATLAFAAAPAAHATVSPPGSAVGQVCGTSTSRLADAANSVAAATNAVAAATTDLATKQAAMTTAQNNLVTALIDYIQTVDAGGSVGGKYQILSDTVSVFSDKAVAWSNAVDALNFANKTLQVANINSGILNSLFSGLAC